MKAFITFSFFACVLAITSCVKEKEPIAKICNEEPQIITTKDTLVLTNCSEFYTTQLWSLPGGLSSTQNSVAFASPVAGKFIITLKVGNEKYANNYIATRNIEVIKAP